VNLDPDTNYAASLNSAESDAMSSESSPVERVSHSTFIAPALPDPVLDERVGLFGAAVERGRHVGAEVARQRRGLLRTRHFRRWEESGFSEGGGVKGSGFTVLGSPPLSDEGRGGADGDNTISIPLAQKNSSSEGHGSAEPYVAPFIPRV
jgi:hypothetical protein